MKIILPLTVTLPRKTKADKVFALNLNIYRNAHYTVLNQAKILYCELVRQATVGMLPMANPPFLFTYTLFPGSGRSLDVNNVCSVVDKFTADALQELGLITNDNYKVVPKTLSQFGGVDKENPRCELEIRSLADRDISDTFKIADELF